MEIVKRNLLSIICGVIALIAVVSIFFPMEGFYDDLAAKLQKSKTEEEAIKTQMGATFNLPTIDPKKTEPTPLPEGAYPYTKLIEDGKKVVAELATQANELVNRSREFNKRPQLVEGALPNAVGAARSTFKSQYYYKFEEFKQRLNLVTPPTEADFQEAADAIWERDWKGRVPVQNGQPINEQAVREEFEKTVASKLPDQIKRERAMKASMYLAGDRPLRRPTDQPAIGGRNFGRGGGGGSPGAEGFVSFDYHPGIPPLEDNNLPDPVNIWIAQLSLWIQEDIVNAIHDTNVPKGPDGRPLAPPPNVENAIVKRLVRITIPKDYITRTGNLSIAQALQQQTPAGPGGAAADGTAEDPNASTKSFNTTPTGRVNNPVYDVMHFQVVVDVDALQFRSFMANMARNRFVTVLKADAKAVDRERALQFNYYYGPAPVVQLTLRCEAIFFRDWTVPLMPKEIKTLLQIPDPAQQPAATENQ